MKTKTGNYLVVVDMQKDFIDGALGSKEACAIVPAVVDKIRSFEGTVVYTMDTHTPDYLKTQEGTYLPVEHCIKETEGWQLEPEIDRLKDAAGSAVFEKGSFGSRELAQFLAERYQAGELTKVELVGLCTDICVVSNALLIKAFAPELPIFVDASCCAGVTVQKHDAALETMRSCQIQVYND